MKIFIFLATLFMGSNVYADSSKLPNFQEYQKQTQELRAESVFGLMKLLGGDGPTGWEKCLRTAWELRERCFAEGGNAYECEIHQENQKAFCDWMYGGIKTP
ncbi:hypothetical protein [Falsihalocynthiibacter arcticus]|uniref:Uncharacterized protein n=1 Tax=Falsihalocynthiibacter arcticus TaxID=1579316 RepID=A0A126V633_9RHOB|nr:hypothetical protein [Falsihalocynthiibacter arcticus]AML53788.1 hypothetical protein RC74_21275 [Falsihalocynthiibacter arcticus]